MKLRHLLLFVIAACGITHAQTTTVSASNLTYGTPVTGQLLMFGVDSTGVPQAFSANSHLYAAGNLIKNQGAFTAPITNGAVSLAVPSKAGAVSSSPLCYYIRVVYDTTQGAYSDVGTRCDITGSTVSLDVFVPPTTTPIYLANYTHGAAAALPSACAAGALYNADDSHHFYSCGTDAVMHDVTGTGGGSLTLAIGTVQTGAAGSSAAASLSTVAGGYQLNLTIPTGATGLTGNTGTAGTSPTVSINTVTTLAAGSSATVAVDPSSTSSNIKLNFGIPQGAAGTGSGSAIALKINGTANGSQTILNLKAGTNMSIADDGVGGVTINEPIRVPTAGLAALSLFDAADYNAGAMSVVIQDKSGNGNTGTATLSSNLTWSQVGGGDVYALNYGTAGTVSSIINVTGVSSPRTIIEIFQGTATAAGSGGLTSPLAGYSNATTGFAYFFRNLNLNTAVQNPAMYLTLQGGATSAVTMPGSYNMVAMTLQPTASASTPNGFWLNGTPMPCLDNASCGATFTPSGGNVQIGGSATGTGSSVRSVSLIGYAVYTTIKTTAEIQQFYAAVAEYYAKRGIDISVKTSSVSTPEMFRFISTGSSLQAGYLSNTPPSATMTLPSNYTVSNAAVSASGIYTRAIAQGNAERFYYNPRAYRNIYDIGAPTNDLCTSAAQMYGGNFTPLQAWAYLESLINSIRLFDPTGLFGIETMLSRGGNAQSPNTGTCDAAKNSFNALARSYAGQIPGTYLIDVAADAALGADGAYSNTTYFQSDTTHKTVLGEQHHGAIMQAAVLANTSTYTAASPATDTATTHVMTSSERFFRWTPTAAATGTLPDCTGLTGLEYQVTNPSTFGITMSGANSETLVGSGAVAAGATVSFRVMLYSPTAGNCYWQQR